MILSMRTARGVIKLIINFVFYDPLHARDEEATKEIKELDNMPEDLQT